MANSLTFSKKYSQRRPNPRFLNSVPEVSGFVKTKIPQKRQKIRQNQIDEAASPGLSWKSAAHGPAGPVSQNV
jgi:hypothetical protein